MKGNSIQIVPTVETVRKIDALKEQLRTSRAGLCNLAIDFILPKLESGEAQVVNGSIEIISTPNASSPQAA